VDFIDLKTQYQRIKLSVQKRINDILDRAGFIMGSELAELEEKLAHYTGTKYCLTCASGTDALLMPLMAQGIGPGDAVFTTTFTFIATAEVISLLGATPVFVDIDPHTYNIDPVKLRQEINKVKNGEDITPTFPKGLTPKAIIPVDLFGLCADYNAIHTVAQECGLFVLEDAAQSFGASIGKKKACSFGDMAATSFFPAKPLGCYGDGGAVFCNDTDQIEILRSLRIHGQGSDRYENVRVGINGRMDTIQAAVVLAKLEIFESEMEQRQTVAQRYSQSLPSMVTVPSIPATYRSAWAQYSIRHQRRDEIMFKLKKAGIPTAIYYPKPLHLQKAFAFLGYEEGNFPVAEDIATKIFSLPMHPYLEEGDQAEIAKYFTAMVC
jgi:UDP-2-acetamido-2-deoxy-ribo-hexuluronate aminotransferase